MGVKLKREKSRHGLLSFIYKMSKFLPFGSEKRLKFFLDLEWIFDRLAHEESFKLYPEEEHPVRVLSKKYLLSKLSSDQTVMDLGCNQGAISNYIAEKAKSVIGIDYNAEMIALAKTKYSKDNLKFEVGEAHEFLTQFEGEIDVLVLSHILEHIEEPKEFLAKFKHFFKYVYIEVPDFERYYLNVYRKDKKVDLIYSDNDHVAEFDREEIMAIIQACDLTILDVEFRFGVQRFWCQVN